MDNDLSDVQKLIDGFKYLKLDDDYLPVDPITSLDAINELEAALKDRDFRQLFVRLYRIKLINRLKSNFVFEMF